MPRTTSFTLSDKESTFITQQVEKGAYGSASDLVRAAIAALAEETEKEANWRSAIDEGLASKRAKPGVFARVRKKHLRK